jgi:hypothetical protein
MTKIEIPTEVAEEIVAEAAQRNGDAPRASEKSRVGKGEKDRAKRLNSLLDGVTQKLFETLSEAKRRQDYDLFLQATDRLIQVAELEARRLEELSHG